MIPTHQSVQHQRWAGQFDPAGRDIATEAAVAVVVNGSTYAVMMATPADLEDFAIGFALTEGMIAEFGEIERFEIVEHAAGMEARLWVAEERARALAARRRAMAGPTGCGLCGIESLEQALRTTPRVEARLTLSPDQIMAAIASLRPAQSLNALTHAVHAAALWHPEAGLVALREDVGRHNALDKLAGAARRQHLPAADAALLLTSRISVELVQKAAVLGTGILLAISAPTTLAIQTAQAANITLLGVARDDGFEVFTHGWRVG
ncbi:formate dehydrogenase accessory sulfurtransferase FdhD [Devosia sp. 1566]|uniref:formate dehydrogenase accessory sulfurtransferase FdhD n=1 Tax=Devosia sp. 1566 TaxID=2499144 RepID=UPI000FD79C6D|nr:formate dehydrogenase accessory sulfurtransferase FdhD [Devosia sp. 1566]